MQLFNINLNFTKMKKINLFYAIVVFAILNLWAAGRLNAQEHQTSPIKPSPVTHTQTDAFSQITISLMTPPPGKLGIADMWKATITNTGDAVKIYFYGTLTEKKAGLIATATTVEMNIKKGVTILKASDFPVEPDVSYPNPDSKYKEALIRKGSVPPGEYSYCVYVKQKTNNEELAFQCIDVTIEDIDMINLINPADEDKLDPKISIVFSWMSSKPQKDVSYSLRVVEVLVNQSPETAFKNNNAWFEKDNIHTPTLSYPKTAKQFEKGKKYAWGVFTKDGLQSEINTFVMETSIICPDISFVNTGGCCFDIYVNNNAGSTCNSFTINSSPQQVISGTAVNGTITPGGLYTPSSYPNAKITFVRTSPNLYNIIGEKVGSICFSGISGTIYVDVVQWSTDGGWHWDNSQPIASFTLNCTQDCNCTNNQSGPAIVSFGSQTLPMECGINYTFHPDLTNPAQVNIHLPEITCNLPGCGISYSYSIYRVLPSFLNPQNGYTQDFSYTFTDYGTYYFVFTAKCGTVTCYNCVDSITLSDCECYKLNGGNYATVTPPGFSPTTVPNYQSFPHNYLDPTLNFVFPMGLCNPQSTQPDYVWYIYDVLNPTVPIDQGIGNTFSYDFTNDGNYLITYYFTCCNHDCDSTKIYINRAASSDCHCSSNWGSTFQVNYTDNIGQEKNQTKNCSTNNVPVIYNVGRNTPMTYTLNSPYNCVGFGTTDCPSYYYRVNYHPSEIPVIPLTQTTTATTTGIQFQTPPDGGYYCFEIFMKCGITNCDSCKFYFNVQDTCKCPSNGWNATVTLSEPIGPAIPNFNCFPSNSIGPLVYIPSVPTIANFSFTGYTCNPTPPCTTLYRYKLTDLSTGVILESKGFNDPLTALSSGNFTIPQDNPSHIYRFVMYAVCDCFSNVNCDSCGFVFTVKPGNVECPPPNPNNPNTKTLTIKENSITRTYSCGSTTQPTAYKGKTYTIGYNFANFACIPAAVQPAIDYRIFYPASNLVGSGTMQNNASFNYIFQNFGEYIIKFYIRCGTDYCDSCIYKVKVTDGCGCGPFLMGKSFQVFQYIDLGVIISDTVSSYTKFDSVITNRTGYWDSVGCRTTIDLRNESNCNKTFRFENIGGCTIPIGSVCPVTKYVIVREYNNYGVQTTQYSLPLTSDNKVSYNFNSTSHNYILTFYKYCGIALCIECKIYIRRTNGIFPLEPYQGHLEHLLH